MQKFILFIFLLFSVFCLQAQIDPSTGGKGKKTKPETSKFGKKGNTEVDINKLYPFPNNLDELIVPEGKTWGTKSVADWWANLPDDTKDYILSDAMEPPVSIESIYFDTTTFANNVGIIFKDSVRFLHDFSYGFNGTVKPKGYNIFLGKEAGNFLLGSTATGTHHSSYNIGIGYRALTNATKLNETTCIGAFSGEASTENGYHSALGFKTLQSNTTGTQNTAIGYVALRLNTTGDYSTAIGSASLELNTTGSNNTAVGASSMSSANSVSYTTAIGQLTLVGLTSGNYNTALGYSAGRYYTSPGFNNTNADSCIYIGSNTKASANDESNAIVIGTEAFTKGSHTANIGNSQITVLYLAGSVGWFQGNGSPEGVVTAPIGSYYSRKNGGAGSTFYVKESGTGNTGWVAK